MLVRSMEDLRNLQIGINKAAICGMRGKR
jgi:hypothetical protein